MLQDGRLAPPAMLYACVLAVQELFVRPMVCSDGFSYSHAAITQWMTKHNPPTSPMTNEVCSWWPTALLNGWCHSALVVVKGC